MNDLSHSREAEQATLGSVLVKPSCLREIANLSPSDFLLAGHQELLISMREVAASGRPANDLVLLLESLRSRDALRYLDGGELYVSKLLDAVSTGESIRHYADIVASKALQRRLVASCTEIAAMAQGDVYDPAALISEAVRKLMGLRWARAEVDDLDTIGARVQDEIERAERGELTARVRTGIRELDDKLGGGLRPGLVVPMGLTGMGKSSLALQWAFRGASDRNVAASIHTLEMTREEVWVKGATSIGRADAAHFEPVKLSDERRMARWDVVNASAARMSRIKPIVRVSETKELESIVAEVTAWRTEHTEQAMAVIDHFQHIQVTLPRKGATRREEIEYAARRLKDLGDELKMPVIVPSQMDNDAAKDVRPPRLGDSRECKAIEHEAKVVIGIHRDRSKSTDNECELIVLKNRFGATGAVEVAWVGNQQGFEDKNQWERNDARVETRYNDAE